MLWIKLSKSNWIEHQYCSHVCNAYHINTTGNLRPCLRSHDQRRRSSTTPIGGITPDQLQQMRGISPSSAAVSNLTNTGKLSPLLSRARLDKHHLPIQRRSIAEEHVTSMLTRQMAPPGDQLLAEEYVTCGSQDNVSRRLPVSVDCDVTHRRPSKETIKKLKDDKLTRRLSRESSDGNKRLKSPRTSSTKQSLPDYSLQMKIIITLLIIVTIVVAVMMLSYWIRRIG